MLVIDFFDLKGDYWRLIWTGQISPYLYKGNKFYKTWWYAPKRPHELRNYDEVPLPVFTDWWP